MRTTICGTRFWTDRDSRSVGIRSANEWSNPLETYITRAFRFLPDFNFYETDNERDAVELRLSARWLCFTLNFLIRTGGKCPKPTWEWNGRRWGWYFIDRSLVASFGSRSLTWDIPFVSLIFLRHELLSLDRKRVVYVAPRRSGAWDACKAAQEAHSASFPYRYELLNGEAQEVAATINVERRIWRWKWTPFKHVRESIDVQFSDEVGPARGSWKGGCIGCGYDLKSGETAIQCLRRMERERRFER